MNCFTSLDFWFLAFFAVAIIQRLVELAHSKANQATMHKLGFVRADSFFSYIIMVAVHSSWFVMMIVEFVFFPSFIPAPLRVVALVGFISAQSLRFWALRTLGVQWNVNVMVPGVAGAAGNFVASGPYKFVRHPNYLAVILEFLTLPIAGRAPLCALFWSVFNGVVLWFRIRQEDILLFGRPGYREVMGGIPRLFPRFGRFQR